MSKFFEIFGKISLILLVLGSLTYGGFYFGSKAKDIQKTIAVNTVTSPDPEVVMPSPSPIANDQKLVTVSAGVSKNAGLSFDQYTITVPENWTSKKESQTTLDEKLTLEKDGYTISIFQAATGGAICLYQGDADFEGPSSKFEKFTLLTTKDSKNLRRSLNLPVVNTIGTSFTVCQKSADGSYQQPTSYGHISIKIPSAWDEDGLKVVDSIVSSLKKI